MQIELTYSDVESILAELNNVAPDKRVAFRARLKHFQRLGFPEGANTGTGRRAVYTVPMLFKLVLAVELVQVGMPPRLIAEIIDINWPFVLGSIRDNLSDEGETLDQFHWFVDVNALEDLQEKRSSNIAFNKIRAAPVSKVEDFVGERRTVVINGPNLSNEVLKALSAGKPEATLDRVLGDLKEESSAVFHDPRYRSIFKEVGRVLEEYDPSLQGLVGQMNNALDKEA